MGAVESFLFDTKTTEMLDRYRTTILVSGSASPSSPARFARAEDVFEPPRDVRPAPRAARRHSAQRSPHHGTCGSSLRTHAQLRQVVIAVCRGTRPSTPPKDVGRRNVRGVGGVLTIP